MVGSTFDASWNDPDTETTKVLTRHRGQRGPPEIPISRDHVHPGCGCPEWLTWPDGDPRLHDHRVPAGTPAADGRLPPRTGRAGGAPARLLPRRDAGGEQTLAGDDPLPPIPPRSGP